MALVELAAVHIEQTLSELWGRPLDLADIVRTDQLLLTHPSAMGLRLPIIPYCKGIRESEGGLHIEMSSSYLRTHSTENRLILLVIEAEYLSRKQCAYCGRSRAPSINGENQIYCNLCATPNRWLPD